MGFENQLKKEKKLTYSYLEMRMQVMGVTAVERHCDSALQPLCGLTFVM